MLSRSLHQPLSVRVRVLVGPVAGAAWGAGYQICADCYSRVGSMVGAVPHVCALVPPVMWGCVAVRRLQWTGCVKLVTL
jgi:hypothetical protein